MIRGIVQDIKSINIDDFLHFLVVNNISKDCSLKNSLLLETGIEYNDIIHGKFTNWFELNFSQIEKYDVGKFKTQDGRVYNFLFRKYYYFMCSEDEMISSKYLMKQKHFLERNPLFGKCKILTNKTPFTPSDKIINPIDFLRLKTKIEIKREDKTNFYLFKSIYRIQNQAAISKYYQNFKDIRRFYETNNISPSGSYKIDLSKLKNIEVLKRNNTTGFYVSDDNIRYITENQLDPIEVDTSVLSFDIEVEHYGKIPSPFTNSISHIGIEWYSNKFKRSIILCNKDMIKEPIEELNSLKSTRVYDSYDIIHKFNKDFQKDNVIFMYMSERDMLLCFNNLLVLEPDVILTFNGHSFDFEYIKKRGELLLKENILYSYNILSKSEFEFRKKTYKSSNEIRNVNRIDMFSKNNILFVDIMDYCKTHILSCSSYSLDSISKKLFNINCGFSIDNNIITINIKRSKKLDIFVKVLKTSNFCFIDDVPFVIVDKRNIINDDYEIYSTRDITDYSFKIKPFSTDLHLEEIFGEKETVTVYLSKDAVDIGNPESYKHYDLSKSQVFAVYCRHDAMLCRYIYDMELIHDKILNYSDNYLLPQEEALVYKASTNINGNLLKQVIKFNYVLYKTENLDLGLFEGGYVYEPKKRYFNNPILCLDFTSLYPTCILEGNISPDTLVFNINTDDKIYYELCLYKAEKEYKYPDYCVLGIVPTDNKKNEIYQIIVFDRTKKGIIPSLLGYGMKKRKEFKTLAKTFKDDIVKFNFYDSGQYGQKIIINSIYGLNGLKTFPLGLKTCAIACCALGRKTIRYTISLVDTSSILSNNYSIKNDVNTNIFNDNLINKSYTLKRQCPDVELNVIYGDTDSIFVEIIGLGNIKSKEKIDTARAIGSEIENILNNSNLYTDQYNIEFEAIYFPFVLCKKKKYLGEKYSTTENDYNFDELKKGISLIRRDYSEFHKKSIRCIKNKIINNLKEIKAESSEKLVTDAFKDIISETMLKAIDEKLLTVQFMVSCNYSGNYKDKDNKTELLVMEHNKKNKEIIEQGSRFYYVIIVDKEFDYNGETIIKKVNWNNKPITSVNEYKYILSSNDNFSIPDNKRISIEYYLNKILKDITKSFLSSGDILLFRNLFR